MCCSRREEAQMRCGSEGVGGVAYSCGSQGLTCTVTETTYRIDSKRHIRDVLKTRDCDERELREALKNREELARNIIASNGGDMPAMFQMQFRPFAYDKEITCSADVPQGIVCMDIDARIFDTSDPRKKITVSIRGAVSMCKRPEE